MSPANRPYTRAAQLPALLRDRILILDGAMGTMIQRYKLSEAQYRGERFADFAHDVKGNNELLSLTQPQIIREIHDQYLAAGADLVVDRAWREALVQRVLEKWPELVVGLPGGVPAVPVSKRRSKRALV